jgi:hypothetical protein
MNDGLQLLLDRMKTHPEEFTMVSSRWGSLMRDFESVFTQEEWTEYNNALLVARRQLFSNTVMERLIIEEREDREALSRPRSDPRKGSILRTGSTPPHPFGTAPVKAEGQPMVIDTAAMGVPKKSSYTLTDIRKLKALEEWASEQAEDKA